jgi:uncharacterized protein
VRLAPDWRSADAVRPAFRRRPPVSAGDDPGILAKGDTVVVLRDGAGTTVAGTTHANTDAWFMRFAGSRAVDGGACCDSIALNRLWHDVSPAK